MERKSGFIRELKSLVNGDRNMLFDFVCRDLMKVSDSYNWVGIYVLNGKKLVLDTFAGERTEHDVIALGDGLCSMAIVTNAIVNEPDVKENSKYLACFPSTRSELVVPIRHSGKPIGELDLDSDTPSAFTKEDEEFLTQVADIISVRVSEVFRD